MIQNISRNNHPRVPAVPAAFAMPLTSAYHPIERAIHVIGGRWRAILISHLFDGPKRFSDFQRDIPQISQRMLSLDLQKLEHAGIITRIVIPDVPVKIEYRLTPIGTGLREIIEDLSSWGANLSANLPMDEKVGMAISSLP